MKFVSFGDDRVGVIDPIDERRIRDATGLLPPTAPWPPQNMIRLIRMMTESPDLLADSLVNCPVVPLAAVRLNAPISWPNKLMAFPTNYEAHIDEMKSANRSNVNGFFLKANSSLSGPSSPILLPATKGYSVHHECELGIVIGKGGRDISPERSWDHIFGYSCLIDVTIRGDGERVMRKSFDSFTPFGPWITTADEADGTTPLTLSLWVNDELRQEASTKDLIVGIADMVALVSSVSTLYPGDIIATGTPAGVGPLRAGDTVRIRIERVGEMSIAVVQGSSAPHIVFPPR